MSSTPEDIDELIARHKAALKRIEETKTFFSWKKQRPKAPTLPFVERVQQHLSKHAAAWTNLCYLGAIFVLSLRLVRLRREFQDSKTALEERADALETENSKLNAYAARVDESWGDILNEVRNGGWRSGSLQERVEKIMEEVRASRQGAPPKEQPQEKAEKPKRFLV